jgi:hypothetical protein
MENTAEGRKYAAQACTNCRTKHRRCDGQSPCSRCVKWKQDCFFTSSKPRGGYRGNLKKNERASQLQELIGNSIISGFDKAYRNNKY